MLVTDERWVHEVLAQIRHDVQKAGQQVISLVSQRVQDLAVLRERGNVQVLQLLANLLHTGHIPHMILWTWFSNSSYHKTYVGTYSLNKISLASPAFWLYMTIFLTPNFQVFLYFTPDLRSLLILGFLGSGLLMLEWRYYGNFWQVYHVKSKFWYSWSPGFEPVDPASDDILLQRWADDPQVSRQQLAQRVSPTLDPEAAHGRG